MEEAVHHRRENDAHACDERQPAEQRVAAGKNLPGVRLRLRQRPHAGQNHRRVFKRIQPRQSVKVMITEHPDTQRAQNDGRSDCKIPRQPFVEFAARQ